MQKDFRDTKNQNHFLRLIIRVEKLLLRRVCSHERRRRKRRRKRRQKTLSSFRGGGGGGGGQKAASPSRLRRENSPPFLRRHRVGIHNTQKREEEISLRSFRFEGHTQQQHRERPTVVVTVPVFFAAFGTRRRSRDHAKPKRGCATQRTTSKTRRWCA